MNSRKHYTHTVPPTLPGSAHDILLCEKQLANRWAVSLKKIQKDRYTGGGVEFIRLGRAIRYRLSDVIAYEEANRFHHTSQGGEP